jgi:hypothetical protein
MKKREYKHSKKLGKKIVPYTLEYVKLCKLGSKTMIQKYLDDIKEKVYQDETERWISSTGMPNPDHSHFMAGSAWKYEEEEVGEIRANKQITLDEEVLFFYEEERQILNEISDFINENKKLLKSDDSIPKKREHIKDIARYNELCMHQRSILRAEKYSGKYLPEAIRDIVVRDQIRRLDREEKEMKKLLRRKGYRDSFEKVVLFFLDINKKCKEVEIIKMIVERAKNAEDVYEAGERMILPGSAYSAKK